MNMESRSGDLALAASAALGLLIGAFLVPAWQDAVETGQVLAGVVQYPHDNPLYGYHVQVWTIIAQGCGLLLALGVSEHAASILVSGLMGALAFAALNQVAWALSRNSIIAFVAPCLAFATYQTADQYGVVYPIFALGNRSTHGIIALNSATLLLGLWGARRFRAAACLTGLLPAVHPIMAVWCWSAIAVVGIIRRESVRSNFRPYVWWFIGGFGMTLVSFAVQLYLARNVPDVPADVQEQFRAAYTENWDLHRKPVDLFAPGMFITVAVGLLLLATLRGDPNAAGRAMQQLVLAATGVSLLLAAVSWMADLLPSVVGALMPGRFLNPIIFIAPAVLLGVLGRHIDRRWAQFALIIHGLFIAATRVFPGDHVVFRWDWHWIEMVTLLLCTGIAIIQTDQREPQRLPKAALACLCAVALLALGASTGRLVRKGIDPPMLGRQNDTLMLAISEGDGLLATASNIGQIQIRARRPVLLNGAAIDFLPYFPETGPAMNRILARLYGVDLLSEPPAPDPDYARYLEETYGPDFLSMRDKIPELNPGQLPTETGRDLWESWNSQQWQAVSQELGFTQVLTFKAWKIDLPQVAKDDQFVLYNVSNQHSDDLANGP